MAVILEDPTRPQDPTSRNAFPDIAAEAKLGTPRTVAEELLVGFRSDVAMPETSFELESHGGYARTVTGTVAYLDEQAQTFMVHGHGGGLIRVPLRDVTSAQAMR